MVDSKQFPPLKSLHSESFLNPAKLAQYDRLTTEVLLASLALEEKGCLKTRPDGTILDGHHRIHILRMRGIEVDTLPREVLEKDRE
jgi:hypothetical protein